MTEQEDDEAFGQDALFEVDVRLPSKRWEGPPPGLHYVRYTPRTRQLCAVCIKTIHEHGQALAPYPAPVRWKVSQGALTELMCERHKQEVEECP